MHKHYHIAFKITRTSSWQLDSVPFTSYEAAKRMPDNLNTCGDSAIRPYRQKIIELDSRHCAGEHEQQDRSAL